MQQILILPDSNSVRLSSTQEIKTYPLITKISLLISIQ